MPPVGRCVAPPPNGRASAGPSGEAVVGARAIAGLHAHGQGEAGDRRPCVGGTCRPPGGTGRQSDGSRRRNERADGFPNGQHASVRPTERWAAERRTHVAASVCKVDEKERFGAQKSRSCVRPMPAGMLGVAKAGSVAFQAPCSTCFLRCAGSIRWSRYHSAVDLQTHAPAVLPEHHGGNDGVSVDGAGSGDHARQPLREQLNSAIGPAAPARRAPPCR